MRLTIMRVSIGWLRQAHQDEASDMNRRKKLSQEYQQQKKIANPKVNPKNKTPYVAKADRAKRAEGKPE